MSDNLVKISRKVVEEVYAFHGKEAIDGMLDIIKTEIFDYIESKDDEYYSDISKRLIENKGE